MSNLCHFRCGIAGYREFDHALGLSDLASEALADARTGKAAGIIR